MFVLTEVGTGGVYACTNKEKLKTVTVFENEDDAERYAILLEANDYHKELELMEVDPEIIAMNCVNYNYKFTIIKSNELIVPIIKE
ncbi:hypothetical protein [Synechococcus phage metaG-MbCM1]|uniref:Uncharacterized protein n=1 Tax=Synechococcus phage metaG-MbCM1 TaxID=1079999 RepID=H8ZNC4_9CAUD|nr:hypothetical protein [Synechococcus phage metaG-MbCM1]AFD02985.1 hypothetical protein [Synechococcus phage metaG-MbCM1]